jgi:hypothetical protein
MKTITFVGYKRPAYTNQVLSHLALCDGLTRFDRMEMFIEPGYDEVVDVCRHWASRLPLPAGITVNAKRLGVADNPLRALSHVFETLGSDFNVAIEDDAVLSPDAISLALWFAEQHGGAESRYAFLNFCDHYVYRGNGRNGGGLIEHPSLLAESPHLSSPFAWCFTRHRWPFAKRHWNTNVRSIQGWDWSIRFGMRIEGVISLTPVLSRCRNIGELDGTWDTPESWAAVQLGLNHSDGSYRGDYSIVNPVSPEVAHQLCPWMIPEIPRIVTDSLLRKTVPASDEGD